jgi:signal transduction histidine kinase
MDPARKATTSTEPPSKDSLADLGHVASRIVHEIRNPLNAMRMQAAVIRTKLSEPTQENLDIARDQLTSLEAEIVRIEELAKAFLEYGKPPPAEPEVFDVGDFIHDTITLLEPELDREDLSIAVIDESTGDNKVCMDQNKLQQVIQNLITNAAQAIEGAGQITLTSRCDREKRVVIEVADSGRGIPKELQSRILEPYVSGSGGSGLGLSIARQIVESAGGTIYFESEPDQGTRFYVELPQAG